jgi:hypothetical protein
MPDSPDTQNRLFAVQEETRRELAKEFRVTDSRPQGLILPNVDVRSPSFEAVLPELLNYSQRARLVELRSSVGRVKEATDRLLRVTEEGAQTSDRLLRLPGRLLYAALATLGVAFVALAISVLQLVR